MKGSLEQLRQALIPLGEYKTLGQQFKFNCPNCENVLGYEVNKFNLELNYQKDMFHCWACGQHGNIETLIKKYGYKEFASLFKREKDLQNTKEVSKNDHLELPKNLMNVSLAPDVLDYLVKERGISREVLKEREVKYCYDGPYKDCIIFPSYTKERKLNAFVSHNFITKKYKKRKIKDCSCFYESFIDTRSLVIITEGVYDALTVPNATPMLGIGLDDMNLDFLSETNVLLIVDNDVNDSIIESLVKKLETVCNSVKNHKLNNNFQDLNHYHVNDSVRLMKELDKYY